MSSELTAMDFTHDSKTQYFLYMSEITASEIIEQLDLEEHPEGGYFRETYRGNEMVLGEDDQKRSAGTGIYFLLTEGVCTNWHRVRSDELWHFYEGEQLVLEVIDDEGNFQQLLLGDELSDEGKIQQLVPKNCWQRAYSTGHYTLVGCTVHPGFEFKDFEMIESGELANQFPDIGAEIVRNPFA
jgi:predicted cupin superfamily sugar epimerase